MGASNRKSVTTTEKKPANMEFIQEELIGKVGNCTVEYGHWEKNGRSTGAGKLYFFSDNGERKQTLKGFDPNNAEAYAELFSIAQKWMSE